MKRKTLIAIWIASIPVEIFVFLMPIIFKWTKYDYLFPKFVLPSQHVLLQVLVRFIPFVLLNVAIVVAYKLGVKRNKTVAIILFATLIPFLVLACATSVSSISSFVRESRTDSTDNFGVFDEAVSLDFEVLKAEDLLAFEQDELVDYSYRYYKFWDDTEFHIEYTVKLSDGRYAELYSLLQGEPMFVFGEDGASNVIEIGDGTKGYKANELWRGSKIVCNDDNTITFEFHYRFPLGTDYYLE